MVFELALLFWAWQPLANAFGELYRMEWERQKSAHGDQSSEAAAAARDWGLFELRQKNYAAAVKALEWAEAVQPEEASAEALAEAYRRSDRTPQAIETWQRLARSTTPARAAHAMTALGDLSADRPAACRWYQQALNRQATIPRWNDLGLCQRETNHLPEAIAAFEKALLLDPTRRDPETGATLNNLASALLEAGRLPAAERFEREAHTLLRNTLGAGHPRTALALSNLADIVRARGRLPEARQMYERAYTVFTQRLGASHPWTQEAAAALQSLPRTQLRPR